MTQPTKNHNFKIAWAYDSKAAYSGIHAYFTMEDNLDLGALVMDLIVTQTDELLYWSMREQCKPEEI